MPSDNYDFMVGYSPDEIEKFNPLALVPMALRGLKAGAGAIKNKVGVAVGGAKASTGKAVGGAKAAGDAAGAAEGIASAVEAVESAAPKPSLPKASDGTDSVPLPEPPAAEPAAEMPEPEEPSGAGGNKTDYKKVGMQLAGQMQAQNAQRKQAQEQRAMDMARRGASVQTGEPMNIAMRLLKDVTHSHDFEETDDDVQEYFDTEVRPLVLNPKTPRPFGMMSHKILEDKIKPFTIEGIPPDKEMRDLLDEHAFRYVENDPEMRGSPVSNRGFSHKFQDANKSQPMNLAWRLLKEEDKGFHPEDTTNEYPGYDPRWPYPTDEKIGQTVPDAQKTEDGKPITLTGDTQGWLASRPKPIKMRTNSQGQPSFMYLPFAGAGKEMKNPAT